MAMEAIVLLKRNMRPHLRPRRSKRADLCPSEYGVWDQVQEQVWKDEPRTMVDLASPC